VLHYPAADALIKEDDLVLIDFCPRSNYYASDISRAFPATGRFSPRWFRRCDAPPGDPLSR